jgi:hypothetical protein
MGIVDVARFAWRIAGTRSDDRVDFEPDEFGGDLRRALLAALGPAVCNLDRRAVIPAKFAQSLHKGSGPLRRRRWRGRT